MKKLSFILLFLAIVSLGSMTAGAASINVSDYTSLANAITAAVDGDTITVTQDITISAALTITNKAITIEGNGFTLSVPSPGLDASGIYNSSPSTFRVFNINASGRIVALNHMVVKGGSVAASGAGIVNNSGTILRLTGVTISNCLCASGGGGLSNSGGEVYLKDCNISRNAANNGGGFVNAGKMFIENSTLSENRSTSNDGGGGAGENQGSLFINNSTFANNKSTELGGAINNNAGTIYAINSTFTGNVAYGSFSGGAIAINYGGVTAVNSIFAYNYRNTGTLAAPVYALNDVNVYAGSKANCYYCISQNLDNNSVNTSATNITYSAAADGSDNTMFTGGANTRILAPNGTPLGTNTVFQPFLMKASAASAPTAVLKTGSFALGKGTNTGFINGNGTPTIGYYDSSSWITLTGSNAGNYQVSTDQNYSARAATPAGGAVETTASNVYMLKVNSAANGSVNGGTVYGDVYASGTSVTLTAIPNSGYGLTRWDYVLGGSGTASTSNPYTLTINADTTLVPVYNVQVGYTVTYMGNGNTSGTPPAVQTSAGGATVISDQGTLVKTGYVFTGWNTNANGSGTSYNVGATYNSVSTNLALYAQYQIASYAITSAAGAHGAISPSGSTTVNAGASQQYVITPNAGYHVDDVLVDSLSVGATTQYTFTNVTSTHSINATFAINTYAITSAAGANGAISPTGSTTINSGSSQQYDITPNAGYHVATVLVDSLSVGATTQYTFSNITSTHSISATFAINTYVITSAAGAHGTISPNGSTTINSGSSQQYDITPNAGYHVADVLVDSLSVGATTQYTFTNVTSTHTISTSFAADAYAITSSAGAHGTISPNGSTAVNSGSSQQYDITPSAGYHVADVLVDSLSVGATTQYTFTNVTAIHTISASFAINTYAITSSAGANGTISPNGSTAVNSGSSQQYDITPNAGYHVADVLVDSLSVGATTQYTFTNVTAIHTISAGFAINTYAITSSAGANGAISPNGSTTINSGSSQQYDITPSAGYHVADVLVDSLSVGATTQYTFTNVTAIHTISASFAINTYAITSSAGANGAISPNGSTTINSGSSQQYDITPSAGYHVADVLVDSLSVGATTQYTFTNVTANHTISASFIAGINLPEADTFSDVKSTTIKAHWKANGNPSNTEYYCENITAGTNSGWVSAFEWQSSSLTVTTDYAFRVKARNAALVESGWTALGSQRTADYSNASISISGVKIEADDSISRQPTINIALDSTEVISMIKKVYVDGVEQEFDVITSSGAGSFKLRTPLTPGTHTLRIIVAGNSGTEYVVEKTGLKVAAGSAATSGPTLVYPNPYDPLAGNVKITYYLSADTGTKLYVFDTAGRLVWQADYSSGENGGKAGYNEISWDAVGLFGKLTSDAYLIRIVDSSSGKSITKTKLLVWKGGVK